MLESWIAINKKTHEVLTYTTSDGITTWDFNDSRELLKYMRLHKLRREDYVIIAGEIVPPLKDRKDG